MRHPKGFPRCPKCGADVKVNGLGSDSTFFNRFVKVSLKIFTPIAVRVFRVASEIHDWKYHIYQFPKPKADRDFYRDMLLSLKDLPWYLKPLRDNLRVLAYLFYLAVKYHGHEAYHEAQMECYENQHCICLDGFDCDLHPRNQQ